jgi:predicted nucleic acid-binding protein
MRTFFDTNVLVYCIDASDSRKQKLALEVVASCGNAGLGILSTQVLIELYNTLVRKQKLSNETAEQVILAYNDWTCINSDAGLVHDAITLSIRYKKSLWDAMVISAALRSGAQTLLSEDMQHGQRFDTLTIVNPFL